jgi:dTDP-4-amino-4,6-dideoxygalactose transaminase
LEDAAEALGSSINGQKCGTFADISILSFNGNKIITTSGGGALLAKDPEISKKATFLATQARDAAPHYQHSQIGYNYRMSNICAGIGRGQMLVLDERVSQRRHNFNVYKENLSKYAGISFLEEPAGYFSNRWLTTMLVDQTKTNNAVGRETIRLELEKENIESRPLWKPMHLQPVFNNSKYFGNNFSDTLFEQGLCLPSGSNLSSKNLEITIALVERLLSI